MTAAEMGEKILEIIRFNGDASFADIMSALGDEAKGDLSWEISPNTVLWANMSQTLIDAFKLIHDKIEPRPSQVLVYLYDGASLNLPIANNLRKKGYKTLHWFPVVFRLREKVTARQHAKARGVSAQEN